MRELAVRPVDGGEGQSSDSQWEEELTATVDRLDKRLMQHESAVAAEIDECIKTTSVDQPGVSTHHDMCMGTE